MEAYKWSHHFKQKYQEMLSKSKANQNTGQKIAYNLYKLFSLLQHFSVTTWLTYRCTKNYKKRFKSSVNSLPIIFYHSQISYQL